MSCILEKNRLLQLLEFPVGETIFSTVALPENVFCCPPLSPPGVEIRNQRAEIGRKQKFFYFSEPKHMFFKFDSD